MVIFKLINPMIACEGWREVRGKGSDEGKTARGEAGASKRPCNSKTAPAFPLEVVPSSVTLQSR